ncbi:MAG: hypothetical protein DMG15_27015 [Acidobacteria bacterium]|nr:MAG: hypothetical protein DMG15_27015 [Acidobacteriota bacterium]
MIINVKGALSDTWSTKPGPFQLKTAASLLSIREHKALWKSFRPFGSQPVHFYAWAGIFAHQYFSVL